jgi:hypothetical protein
MDTEQSNDRGYQGRKLPDLEHPSIVQNVMQALSLFCWDLLKQWDIVVLFY